ncbi:sialoadhesin-like [Takifugu flavidus]|uniref:sialoadhesin-like n=1 Tax=Takifugu flavidus TaxID=433684 RepID=UPI00254438C3|nr:sialoadhesin-like [Takifugu flavidus]
MEVVVFLLALSTLPQLAEPQAPLGAPFRAVLEMVSGHSRIFSGDDVKLKCNIPDPYPSTWRYLWFKGSEELQQHGNELIIWRARIIDSGKFYCQGVRDTAVGQLHTNQSLPVEIVVDGGWALTRVTPQPALVGHTLEVTCLVRGNRPHTEVILYRDGVEVMRKRGKDLQFILSNLTTEDQGMYSCRASWDVRGLTHSVMSVETLGRVVEILTKPVLEIDVNNNQIPNRMKLICHHEYNLPAPAPPVHFYFYKNDNLLGPATSENRLSVNQKPGLYSCKVRVPELNLVRWSEHKGFGQVPGPRVQKPSFTAPRPWTPQPPALIPIPPTRAPLQKVPVTPVLVHPRDVATQRSVEHTEASTLPPEVQSLNQTTAAPQTINIPEASGDMSGESGDFTDDDSP